MSAPAAVKPRARALDDAIHAIPAEWFRPSRAIYWSDLIASAAFGWAAFAAAVVSSGWTRVVMLALATALLYRAVLFIHEITHLAARDLPMFKAVWNALVGVPLLIPSFLYEGVHLDHHRQRCYGTEADPEYVPYGRRRPIVIVAAAAASLLAPVAFAFRFGVLAPLGWLVPPIGRLVRARASALVINTLYVRQAPLDAAARVEEAAACALVWSVAILWTMGRVPAAAVSAWVLLSASASLVNAIRTLAAHRYDHESEELDMIEQLLDSCTIPPHRRVSSALADATRAIVAPVGLRYHALHHWIPSLPYHNLGRAHRRLVAALAADAPYRATIAPGLTPIIRDLFQRASTRS